MTHREVDDWMVDGGLWIVDSVWCMVYGEYFMRIRQVSGNGPQWPRCWRVLTIKRALIVGLFVWFCSLEKM